jgi:hypothetical protein
MLESKLPRRLFKLGGYSLKRISLMVSTKIFLNYLIIPGLLLFLIFLPACRERPTSIPTPLSTPTKSVDVVNVIEPTETSIVLPAATSTPEPVQELAFLLAPPSANLKQIDEIQEMLKEVLADTGIQLRITSSITEEDLGDHVKIVTALNPPDGISELLRASPGTHFIVIDSSGLTPQNNLSIIGPEGQRLNQPAFMAGVIAAVITPDWRIGTISSDEISTQAFVNGGVYFCGLCRQVYPPFFDAQGTYIKHPLQYTISPGASSQEWQDAARYMIDRGVKTIYLPPGSDNSELVEILLQADISIIGASRIDNIPSSKWVATLQYDPVEPLKRFLPALLQGTGGRQLTMKLDIRDINPDLFSPARLNLVLSTLEDLEAGFISTGIE